MIDCLCHRPQTSQGMRQRQQHLASIPCNSLRILEFQAIIDSVNIFAHGRYPDSELMGNRFGSTRHPLRDRALLRR